MIERWKAEAMAAKQRRTRGEISLSSEEKDESDIRDDTDSDQSDLDQADPDQADDKYLVKF